MTATACRCLILRAAVFQKVVGFNEQRKHLVHLAGTEIHAAIQLSVAVGIPKDPRRHQDVSVEDSIGTYD